MSTKPDEPTWVRVRRNGANSFGLLAMWEMRCAPIPVGDLVNVLGIHTHLVDDPGWDGAMRSSTCRADIWIRRNLPTSRRRFLLAHELGHLMLHPLGREFRDVAPDTVQSSPMGQEASAFAAALLAPRFLVQPLMYESTLSVAEMSTRFGISVPAMSARLDWIRAGHEDF